MIEEIYDRNASLSIYQKFFFIYLYVWSADCNSAIYSELQYLHDNVLAGVGIGILECEYGPGAGVSISGGRGITTQVERYLGSSTSGSSNQVDFA